MKKLSVLLFSISCIAYASCGTGMGCRGNGKNVGAERILSGDPKALKAAKRAGKFRS